MGDDDRQERLRVVADAMCLGLRPSQLVDVVVRQGMSGLGADGGLLGLVVDDAIEVVASMGTATETIARVGQLELGRTLPVTLAVRSDAGVFVGSRQDGFERFPDLARVATSSRAWAALPLTTRGRVFGVLGVSFEQARTFSDDERSFLTVLADLTALALANHEALQRVDDVLAHTAASVASVALAITRFGCGDPLAVAELDALAHHVQGAALRNGGARQVTLDPGLEAGDPR